VGRVMVVDDEPDMRLAVRLVLERYGHIVEEAASGEDAYQRIQGAPPDLLLMDVRMPGQDGLETLGKIRESNKTMPVIIMTGYGNPETEKEAFRKGANHYILKPFRNEDLMEAMARVGLTESDPRPTPREEPNPGYRHGHHSSLLQHFGLIFERFCLVLRQAKAIFIDRWYNPPILFERDPSLEERISLRLSLITDPIKVIYHGLFDKDFEFSMNESVEEQRHPEDLHMEPRESVDALPPPASPVFPSGPMMSQPPEQGQDVVRIQQDLSQQIQSVAQSLQAEIGRLSEQMHQKQEQSKTASESAPVSPAAQESLQQEFHRRLIEMQVTWDQALTATGRELSLGQNLMNVWIGSLSEVQQMMDRTPPARPLDKKTGTDIAPAA